MDFVHPLWEEIFVTKECPTHPPLKGELSDGGMTKPFV